MQRDVSSQMHPARCITADASRASGKHYRRFFTCTSAFDDGCHFSCKSIISPRNYIVVAALFTALYCRPSIVTGGVRIGSINIFIAAAFETKNNSRELLLLENHCHCIKRAFLSYSSVTLHAVLQPESRKLPLCISPDLDCCAQRTRASAERLTIASECIAFNFFAPLRPTERGNQTSTLDTFTPRNTHSCLSGPLPQALVLYASRLQTQWMPRARQLLFSTRSCNDRRKVAEALKVIHVHSHVSVA